VDPRHPSKAKGRYQLKQVRPAPPAPLTVSSGSTNQLRERLHQHRPQQHRPANPASPASPLAPRRLYATKTSVWGAASWRSVAARSAYTSGWYTTSAAVITS